MQLKKIFAFVLIIAILGGIVPPQLAFSMSSFSSPKTLAATVDTNSQQIVASGSNVYVVYTDGANNVVFRNSTDNGQTFKGSTKTLNYGAALGTVSPFPPQIAVYNGRVYVAWEDSSAAGNNEIFFINSTQNTWTFPSSGAINLSNEAGATSPFNPKIAIDSNGRVYVGWEDDVSNTSTNPGKILFRYTTDGKTFTPSTASAATTVSTNADIANTNQLVMNATGTRIYFAWTEPHSGGSTSDDILFRNSTDSGISFKGSAINLSHSLSTSTNPVIAASGNDVYVAWQGNTGSSDEIYFESGNANSGSFVLNAANGGTHGTAGTPINLSSNTFESKLPKIASSGTNAFVTWEDDHISGTPLPSDTKFKKIASEGTDLSNSVINLSSDSGSSTTPDMSVSGNNIFVAWQDTVLNVGRRPSDTSHAQVFFKSSEDAGSTFSGFQNFTSKSGLSINPHLASAGTNSYIVWNDNVGGTDLKFRAGNILPQSQTVSTPFDFRFDATQYRPNATATITLLNTTAWNSVSTLPVTLFSDSSGSGVPVTLSKAATVGQFTGTVTTTNATSVPAGQLKVHGGDAIIARFDAGSAGKQNATASIFRTTVAFDFTQYNRGNAAQLKVTDQSSNLDPAAVDKITVNVKSKANPAGVNVVLTETGADTGIFGDTSSKIYFGINSTGIVPSSGNMTVSVPYHVGTHSPTAIDTLTVNVKSTSFPGGASFILYETGPNTEVFSRPIKFVSTASNLNTGLLQVASGDVITITNNDNGASSNYISNYIAGAPLDNQGIIQVNSPNDDLVTATYNGVSASVGVVNQSGEGGGGGGPVRAGLVLNVVASLSVVGGSASVSPSLTLSSLAAVEGVLPDNIRQQIITQDPNKPLEPQHDTFDYPLSIDGGGYLLGRYSNTIDTVTEKTNTPVALNLNIPATNLQHLALYTDLHGVENDLTKSDTYIIYDKGSPLQIVDPHHYFDHVTFDLVTDGIKNKISYGITFANPMDKANIVLRTWNDRHSSSDVVLLNAWQVVDTNALTSKSESSPLEEQKLPSQTSPLIQSPPESKVPSWVKNNVKLWNAGSIGDTEFETGIQYLISEKIIHIDKQTVEPIVSDTIPKWVKNTAGFWANGDVSEDEFLHSIEYLVKLGLIKVS